MFIFFCSRKKFIDTRVAAAKTSQSKNCFLFLFFGNRPRKKAGRTEIEKRQKRMLFAGTSSDKDQHILNILNGQSSRQTEKETFNGDLKEDWGESGKNEITVGGPGWMTSLFRIPRFFRDFFSKFTTKIK